MAYVHEYGKNRHRAGVALGVALLEGLAIIALIRGLSIAWTPHEDPPPLASRQWKLDPPPPPPADPRKPADPDKPALQPRQAQDLPRSRDTAAPADPPVPFAGPADPGPRADPAPRDPPPSPGPSFLPRQPRPLGSPATWVSANDYPARDLREGNQGVARFSLVVGANGKPQSCLVTMSSGHAGLDEATCKAVMRRARFAAASDESGASVAGTYAGSIRWQIPD